MVYLINTLGDVQKMVSKLISINVKFFRKKKYFKQITVISINNNKSKFQLLKLLK